MSTSNDAKTCRLCGAVLPPPTGRRGRPRVYCGPPCRRLDHLLEWVPEILGQIEMTEEAAEKVRGRLLAAAGSVGS